MGNKLDIAGVQLDNCTVRESMMLLDRASAERAFFSVAEINTDILLRTGTDDRVKKAIEGLNHTILSDEAILKAAGQNTPQRQREVADRIFFRELLRKLEQERTPVCLLGESERYAHDAKEFILRHFPHMNLTDVEILDESTGNPDNLINRINARAQDVVISVLPSPMQEHFFLDYREKLSAALWYGLGPIAPVHRKSWIGSFLREQKRIRNLTKLMAAAAKPAVG